MAMRLGCVAGIGLLGMVCNTSFTESSADPARPTHREVAADLTVAT